MADNDWTMNYEDDMLLNYLEKEANKHQMIATEKITKIWDEIETKIHNCVKNMKTTENINVKNSSPTASYGLQLFPQEYNFFDFNMTHYKIMKSVHTTFHNVYDIFIMFTSTDFTNLELMINNICEVSYHMQIYQMQVESKNSKQNIHQIKTNYKVKYGYIQELIEITSIQKRINMDLLNKVKTRLSNIERRSMDFIRKTNIQRLLYEILSLLQFENTTIIHLSNFLSNFEIAYIKPENKITIEPRQKSHSQTESQEVETNVENNKNKRKNLNETTTTMMPIKRSKQPKIVEVIRNKEERKSLIGHSCPQCIDFYENTLGKDTFECKQAIQLCSRHRTRYNKQPGTPPGFWDLDIHTPEEWKLQDEMLAIERMDEGDKNAKENRAKESQQSQQSQQSQNTLLE